MKYERNVIIELMQAMRNMPMTLRTDSYKLSHFEQLNGEAKQIYLYMESRYGMDQTCVFGFQYIRDNYLTQPITVNDVYVAKAFAECHGEPFNLEGWLYIAEEYGYIPLTILAIPEGTVVPSRTPLAVMFNEDHKLGWLPPYFEGVIQRAWYPTTVCTYSLAEQQILRAYAEKTMPAERVDGYMMFALNDFGHRGCSSAETSTIGGMAHLAAGSWGSDNIEGIWGFMQHYGPFDPVNHMPAFSVRAIEHNVVLSHGEANEKSFIRKLVLETLEKNEIISIVVDTFDLKAMVRYFIEIQDEVRAAAERGWTKADATGEMRKARLVVRPDSGDAVDMPVWVVTELINNITDVVERVGYKVLPEWLRVIQGDGVGIDEIRLIAEALYAKAYAMENIIFGQGGKLLQEHLRDDGGFAIKMSAFFKENGDMVKTSKRPKTDSKKHSKEGLFRVDIVDGVVSVGETDDMYMAGELKPILITGKPVGHYEMADVRANVAATRIPFDIMS